MEVTIKLHRVFKEAIGTDSIRVPIDEDETVDTLLMKISRRYPRLVEIMLDPTTGELSDTPLILLNGRRIRGIHTKLKHKDEVTISPREAEGGPAPVV